MASRLSIARTRALSVLAVLALVGWVMLGAALAGCGGAAVTGSGAGTTSVAGNITASRSGTNIAGVSSVPANASTTVQVKIVGEGFSPSTVQVQVGTTVLWIETDSISHSVVADDGAFNSGLIPESASFAFTFTQPGTFTYHCSIHPTMTGTVVVK